MIIAASLMLFPLTNMFCDISTVAIFISYSMKLTVIFPLNVLVLFSSELYKKDALLYYE